MSKQEIIFRLRKALHDAASQRQSVKQNGDVLAARLAVKRFQSLRMVTTYRDLLDSPETRAAALFFLNDLYGPEDLTQRDSDLERIVPTMEKLLPASALETITEALELDALSEHLDAEMASRLGAEFSAAEYMEAYRLTSRAERQRQIAHVRSVGSALCELVRLPLIGGTLKVMRTPAKLARLSELQSFLERGFKAFKEMRRPDAFVDTVVHRESGILGRLYAGDPEPF
ncbi:FFLEELY motif protein [Noviherbaspirillum sp.]|uniref:FFLEELY motif protein n=1 Tax=Noviherbaspirillum sp. TaxID=1926288 RepID=UPI002FDF73EC